MKMVGDESRIKDLTKPTMDPDSNKSNCLKPVALVRQLETGTLDSDDTV